MINSADKLSHNGFVYNGTRWYTTETVADILEISTSNSFTKRLKVDWDVNSLVVKTSELPTKRSKFQTIITIYDAEQIDRIVYEKQEFYKNHYTLEQARELIGLNAVKAFAKPVPFPPKYREYLKKSFDMGKKYFVYNKNEVDIIHNRFQNSYRFEDLLKLFNASEARIREIISNCELESFVYSPTNGKKVIVYFPEKVDKLLKDKKDFYKKYVPMSESITYYGDGASKSLVERSYSLKRYDIPFWAKDNKVKGDIAFKIGDVINDSKLYKERRNIFNLTNIESESPFQTYLSRLDSYIHWNEFDEDTIYTKEKWLNFVNSRLSRTKSKPKQLNSLINKMVYCTPHIKSFLTRTGKEEIYMLSSSEINLVMRSIKSQAHYIEVYNFIRDVYIDTDIVNNNLKCNFKITAISTISDVFKLKTNKSKNDVYSFDDYSEVFNYCIDIENRVFDCLDEIDSKFTCKNLSCWLYVMLHLNNAWRNGDVKDFPIINVDDILTKNEIEDVSWFKCNSLNLEVANSVIFRINQWEFTMSKTQVRGAFFCSEELAIPLATAVLMLTIMHKTKAIVSNTSSLMLFETKNNETNRYILKNFFRNISIKNFQFKSLKFNKTVMTFMYYIANLTGDSKALLYSMKLRAHLSSSTTAKFYIKLDTNTIEELSRQLFRRGEFGYIPSLLLKKINGVDMSFEDVTDEIEELNCLFGDVVKINNTVAFLNRIRMEEKEVFDEIMNMSLDEAQKLMIDIYARNLPSKDSVNIQCLLGRQDCPKINEECDCCCYHIPSIYAIEEICSKIKHSIHLFNKASTIPEKYKHSISIEKRKRILAQAIKKFGQEHVLSILSWSKDELLTELSNVQSPNEIMLSVRSNA